MPPSYPDSVRYSPYRPTDWRWRRARWLVEHNRYATPRRDDEPTRRAATYLRARARRRQRPAQLWQYRDVEEALGLREGPGTNRILIEAWLLARLPPDDVAARAGVPPPAVVAYEHLHFDVRAHLHARDWVVTRALGPRSRDGRPDPAAALRRFAYYGGTTVLEAVLPFLLGGGNPPEPVPDLSTPEGRTQQAARLAVAAEMLPDDAATLRRLPQIMLVLQEVAAKRVAGARTGSFLAENALERAVEAERPDNDQGCGQRLELAKKHGSYHSLAQGNDLGRDESGDRPPGEDGPPGFDRRRGQRDRQLGCRRQGASKGPAVPAQAVGEHLPALRQPARQRAFGDAEVGGHLLARPALQLSEHQGHAVLLRQAAELLVQGAGVGPLCGRPGCGLRFCGPPPGVGLPHLPGGEVGDPVKPTGDRVRPPDGGRFADQHEEGRLKGVLGVVRVAEHPLAHGRHHRPVAVDEGLEGRVVAAGDQGGDELPITRLGARDAVQTPEKAVQASGLHTL